MIVLGQHNEVIAALVYLRVTAVGFLSPRHIHLAPEDRLEFRLALVAELAVHLVAVVIEFLNAEHVAMVGDGHTPHTIGNGLVNQFRYARLSVENGIISMDMQVYKVLHIQNKV